MLVSDTDKILSSKAPNSSLRIKVIATSWLCPSEIKSKSGHQYMISYSYSQCMLFMFLQKP